MNNLETLDNILLSNNVVDNFYDEYNSNRDFKNWLDGILPEVDKCEKQIQRNPWHKYNVLGHILHSVDEMNKQTQNLPANDRRLLSYTMFLHDMGKPVCHIERMKDGRLIDSFFGHNVESANVCDRVAHNLGFDGNEADKLRTLVYKHDIFMFIKDFPTDNPHWRRLDNNVIDEEIADLSQHGDGKQLMRYLVMIGRSDNLAQNEKMTKDSLAMLDKFDNMIDERDAMY